MQIHYVAKLGNMYFPPRHNISYKRPVQFNSLDKVSGKIPYSLGTVVSSFDIYDKQWLLCCSLNSAAVD
jgi:hypothetical protein